MSDREYLVTRQWRVVAPGPGSAILAVHQDEPTTTKAVEVPAQNFGAHGVNWFQTQDVLDAAWDLFMDMSVAGGTPDLVDPPYQGPRFAQLSMAGLDNVTLSMLFDIAITAYRNRYEDQPRTPMR